jgi:hypothetical protein
MENHVMQLSEQIEIMCLLSAGGLSTTQPGFPATNSTRGVTHPLADNAILTATEVALVKQLQMLTMQKLKLWLQLKD